MRGVEVNTRGARRSGRARPPIARVALLAAGLALLAGLAYTSYGVVVGSDAIVHPGGSSDCRTPMVRYGWAYEAINYDMADDVLLQRANPTLQQCADQGETAGDEVVTTDGVRLAGWYIPASGGIGPTGATVVLVHGWASNKSGVLKYAVPLHPAFNLVAFDLRNGGRSSRTGTTFGSKERLDVAAIIDWLERTKHPSRVAVMGSSMGGVAALLEAGEDPRVDALILDSVHARAEDVIARGLEVDHGQPSVPGTPAILLGIWLRTGVNLLATNPIDAIPALGDRPLLLLHGTADLHDLPVRSVEANYQAARAAGVPVEMHLCPGATHGNVIDVCPDAWRRWSVGFLERAIGGT